MSYDIEQGGPVYPGTQPFSVQTSKAISRGDSSNSVVVTLSNHCGTHIDAPRHFDSNGHCINDFSVDEFFFDKPYILSLTKNTDDPITEADVACADISKDCDCLLLKTGFSRFRTDVPKYTGSNPYVTPEAARWIREHLRVRVLGIDCVSIASASHREAGRSAHAILLRRNGYSSDPILLIEDMYIPEEVSFLEQLIALPIFFTEFDASFCTVVGITHE
jgi:kynurenine formamidase